MIYLLVGFFLTCFLSLFVSSWRVAFVGLALQALFVAGILARGEASYTELSVGIQMTDLFLVRAFLLPLLLIGVLRQFKTGAEFDLIPANLVAWLLAASLIILAYWFGERMFPENLAASLHLGTVAFAMLSALFILSLQSQPLGQVIALLIFESAISLFEALSRHPEPWVIQLGLSLVFLFLLLLVRRFLHRFRQLELASEGPEPETEVL